MTGPVSPTGGGSVQKDAENDTGVRICLIHMFGGWTANKTDNLTKLKKKNGRYLICKLQ